MPFELIRRKEGEISQKQEIRHKNVQISINDYGHLVIREWDESQQIRKCGLDADEHCKNREQNMVDIGLCRECPHLQYVTAYPEEHLIVFDQRTTDRLINFIFSIRSTYEFKKLLADLIKENGLPF